MWTRSVMMIKTGATMRTRIKGIAIFMTAACMIAAVSCDKEEAPIEVEEVIVEEPTPEDPVYRLVAGFEGSDDTRTSLVFDETNKVVKVSWETGDQFSMFGGGYRADYVTSGSGTSAEFTSPHGLPEGPCYSFYPSSRTNGNIPLGDGSYHPFSAIPSVQTAVPGGIASDMNIMVAYSESQSDDLTFRNVYSMVRFRMSGNIVSSIDSVVFDAGTTIAGYMMIEDMETSDPKINISIGITGGDAFGKRTNSVKLLPPSGSTFAGNVDYIFVLAPVDINGFDMFFYGDNGKYVRKHSKKLMSFQRSKSYNFGVINVGDEFPEEENQEGVYQYMTASMGYTPVVLNLIAEGYTMDELSKFSRQAESAADFIFSVEPFKTYKKYFTVNICKVASNESGASVTDGNGHITQNRDTYFKARWGEDSYSDMRVDETILMSYLESKGIGGYSSPATNAVIVNDSRYGGICHLNDVGLGCYAICPVTDEGGPLGWSYPGSEAKDNLTVYSSGDYETRDVTEEEIQNEIGRSYGTWKNTLLHELCGHGCGLFADEYWYNVSFGHGGMPSGLRGRNLSSSLTGAGWQSMIDDQAALESLNPLYSRIGLYQGGGVYMFGYWRSERVSCMIDNRAYFSTWQRYVLTDRILDLAGAGSINWDEFFENDDPTDPVRDIATRSDISYEGIPIMPPTAPPVINNRYYE